MEIEVNGKKVYLEEKINVKELLYRLKVDSLEYVTVQINDELVDRKNFQKVIIKEEDNVEFLYFMGGGIL